MYRQDERKDMSYCCRVPAEVRELSMRRVKDLEMALDLARKGDARREREASRADVRERQAS